MAEYMKLVQREDIWVRGIFHDRGEMYFREYEEFVFDRFRRLHNHMDRVCLMAVVSTRPYHFRKIPGGDDVLISPANTTPIMVTEEDIRMIMDRLSFNKPIIVTMNPRDGGSKPAYGCLQPSFHVHIEYENPLTITLLFGDNLDTKKEPMIV